MIGFGDEESASLLAWVFVVEADWTDLGDAPAGHVVSVGEDVDQ